MMARVGVGVCTDQQRVLAEGITAGMVAGVRRSGWPDCRTDELGEM